MAFTTLAWKLWSLAVLVLTLEMLVIAALTSHERLRAKTFASPEDYSGQGLPAKSERDPEPERPRRRKSLRRDPRRTCLVCLVRTAFRFCSVRTACSSYRPAGPLAAVEAGRLDFLTA